MRNIQSAVKQLFEELSLEHQHELLSELEARVGGGELESKLEDILSGKLGIPDCCPHCQHTKLGGNGSTKGRPRYQCKNCNKTFTGMTGTALHGVHDKKKFVSYIRSFAQRLTLRDAAEEHEISLPTSFEWRHRLMESLSKAACSGKLEGTIQADEKYIPFSCKGSPEEVAEEGRKPRKRGSDRSTRGISNEQVCIISALTDETVLLVVAKRGRIDKKTTEEILLPVTRKKTVNPDTIVTDGETAYGTIALKKGMEHQVVDPITRKSPKGFHIQNLNSLHRRLNDWMRGFLGVASKYLQRYLDYFIIIEKVKPFYRERVQKIFDFVLLNNNVKLDNIKRFE